MDSTAPSNPKKVAARLWGAMPAGLTHAPGLVPGSKAFFEMVLDRRFNHELRWIKELMPFQTMAGKELLELGCGAGYDAYAFCRHGARYIGIDIAPGNPERTKAHLAFYGYAPGVLRADVEALPFKAASFDAAFTNGVLHHTPDMEQALDEAYRVLRPGAEFWLCVYHKNSMFYWLNLFLIDHLFYRGFLKRSFQERLSMIEQPPFPERPLVRVYTRRGVKRLLRQAGFRVEKVWVRKLEREDLPGFSWVLRVRAYIPQGWLNFLGRIWGWYVIARAVKPPPLIEKK